MSEPTAAEPQALRVRRLVRPVATGLAALVRHLWRHRQLTVALTLRELFSTFAGSMAGVIWAFFLPLAQILIYLVVFSVIFRVRFGDVAETGRLDYPLYLISGLLVWIPWATALTGSCNAVIGSAALVKQAHFPIEVLPARTVLAALVPQLVGIPVLILYALVRFDAWLATYLLLPVALLLQTLAMLGTAYLLAALSVFVRDTREVIMLFVMVGIFLIPVFYTPQMIDEAPPAMGFVLAANPFTHFVHVYRDCLFFGEIAHPWSWAIVTALAMLAGSCFHVFERLRMFFGNYL